jgi:hypothetical protein
MRGPGGFDIVGSLVIAGTMLALYALWLLAVWLRS